MTDQDGFHLVLTSAGRPVMHGWWSDGAVAGRKFSEWIGSHSEIKDAAVTLAQRSADGERLLMTWPAKA